MDEHLQYVLRTHLVLNKTKEITKDTQTYTYVEVYFMCLVFEREYTKITSKCEREKRRKKDQAYRKVCMHSITLCYATAVIAVTVAATAIVCCVSHMVRARTNGCAKHVTCSNRPSRKSMDTYTRACTVCYVCE